jgi:hypothetical protein
MSEAKLFNLTKAPAPVGSSPETQQPVHNKEKLFNLSEPPGQSGEQTVTAASEPGKPFQKLIQETKTTVGAEQAAAEIKAQQQRRQDILDGKIPEEDMTPGELGAHRLRQADADAGGSLNSPKLSSRTVR